MTKQKTLEDVRAYVERIAQRNEWQLHSNFNGSLDLLVEGLQTNFNRLSYFNCPCRDSQEDPKLDRDIICPCRYAEPDIKEYRHCFCALFFAPDFDFTRPISMIPERRPESE
ncbi:MAG: ferredoxin-thioredoxin reductase catalytic domain-containing protein [Candidatus Hodarchaeales archaeon]